MEKSGENDQGKGKAKGKAEGEEKQAAAVWAEKRELLPQYLAGSGTPFAAARLNPNYWKWAAAKALRGWDDSTEITSADLDQAIKDATSGRIG